MLLRHDTVTQTWHATSARDPRIARCRTNPEGKGAAFANFINTVSGVLRGKISSETPEARRRLGSRSSRLRPVLIVDPKPGFDPVARSGFLGGPKNPLLIENENVPSQYKF